MTTITRTTAAAVNVMYVLIPRSSDPNWPRAQAPTPVRRSPMSGTTWSTTYQTELKKGRLAL